MKKKSYYLLTFYSTDLVFDFFEEKHSSKSNAIKSLKRHKEKCKMGSATIRLCKDIAKYTPGEEL